MKTKKLVPLERVVVKQKQEIAQLGLLLMEGVYLVGYHHPFDHKTVFEQAKCDRCKWLKSLHRQIKSL